MNNSRLTIIYPKFKDENRIHNCFLNFRPELIDQWNWERNDKNPYQLTKGSHYEAHWICDNEEFPCHNECHKWPSTINHRILSGSNCPFCNGKVCKHNNLTITHPKLCEEWDYERNGTKRPEMYSIGSHAEIYWICKNPNACICHKWKASIKSRTLDKTECPFCKSGKVCPHNNLTITHPKIASQWDYKRNGNKRPEMYSFGSAVYAYWICKKPGVCKCHRWKASIHHRTSDDTGCPFCNSGKICPHNNLTITHKDLCEEWDYENNGNKRPEMYSYGSTEIIGWKCLGCKFKWKVSINQRTGKDTFCPKCAKRGYSKICLKWLKYMEDMVIKSKIQHAGNIGEKVIIASGKRYKLDGFCEKYYFGFEFHGCYWHGCPKCYKRNEINLVNHKTMEELYNKTIEKEQNLINSGKMFLFSIWECEYNEIMKKDEEEIYNYFLNNHKMTAIKAIAEYITFEEWLS